MLSVSVHKDIGEYTEKVVGELLPARSPAPQEG